MVAVASRSGSIPQSKHPEQHEQHSAHWVNPSRALAVLAKMNIQVVLLEAGPTLLHAYWQSGLIDRRGQVPVSMPNGSGKSIQNPRETLSLHPKGDDELWSDRLYRLPIAAN